VLSLFPRARDRAEGALPPRKILVILLSEMGSLVLAQPMLSRLRATYPEASLHALVFQKNREVLELLEALPDDNILTLRDASLGALAADAVAALRTLRRLRIDAVVDCELFARLSALLSFLSGARIRVGFERHTQEGLYRGSFINRPVLYNPYQHIAHQFVTLAEAIDGHGAPTVKRSVPREAPALPRMVLREGEVETMKARLEANFPEVRGKRLVLVYGGGGLLPIRAWPQASFEELVAGLVAEDYAVGIIGLDGDRAKAQAIQAHIESERCLDMTGYTATVRELMLIFHIADLLVTNDGGPGHFAAMTPISSIILFGPETPVLYGSLGRRTFHFYQGLSCSPCLTAYNHRNSPCDGDNQCLKTIPARDVLAKAREFLAQRAG
jgi:ADP-heptose:LPS heptosyltransferase